MQQSSDVVVIKRAVNLADYKNLVEYQKKIHTGHEERIIPARIQHVIATEGGAIYYLTGPDDVIIGYSITVTSLVEGELASQVLRLRIDPEYAGNRLRAEMLMAQRNTIRENGISKLYCACDPLDNGRAVLLFNLLHATSSGLVPSIGDEPDSVSFNGRRLPILFTDIPLSTVSGEMESWQSIPADADIIFGGSPVEEVAVDVPLPDTLPADTVLTVSAHPADQVLARHMLATRLNQLFKKGYHVTGYIESVPENSHLNAFVLKSSK